jgi:hypothetical protein
MDHAQGSRDCAVVAMTYSKVQEGDCTFATFGCGKHIHAGCRSHVRVVSDSRRRPPHESGVSSMAVPSQFLQVKHAGCTCYQASWGVTPTVLCYTLQAQPSEAGGCAACLRWHSDRRTRAAPVPHRRASGSTAGHNEHVRTSASKDLIRAAVRPVLHCSCGSSFNLLLFER